MYAVFKYFAHFTFWYPLYKKKIKQNTTVEMFIIYHSRQFLFRKLHPNSYRLINIKFTRLKPIDDTLKIILFLSKNKIKNKTYNKK